MIVIVGGRFCDTGLIKSPAHLERAQFFTNSIPRTVVQRCMNGSLINLPDQGQRCHRGLPEECSRSLGEFGK